MLGLGKTVTWQAVSNKLLLTWNEMLEQLQVLVQICTVQVNQRIKPERHVVSNHPLVRSHYYRLTDLRGLVIRAFFVALAYFRRTVAPNNKPSVNKQSLWGPTHKLEPVFNL